MEIAGNCAGQLKTKTIKPRHMRVSATGIMIFTSLKIFFHWSPFQLAVDEDFEFTELFESAHVMFFY